MEIAQKAYQLVGREPSATITDTYGWAVAASGIASGDQAQMQEGARLLRQARSSAEASANKFPELYLHLSRVLVALGQGAEAQEAAEAGVALLDQMKKEQKTLDPLVESRMQEALEEARQAAAAGPNASAETSR